MTVPSPCIDVGQMDPATGWCQGCLRTIEEIAAWGAMDDEGKRRVWSLLRQRHAEAGRPGEQPPLQPAARRRR